MRPQSGPRVARIALTALVTALLVAIAKPPSAFAQAAPGFIGINAAGLYVQDPASQAEELGQMQSHGITVVRQFFRWNYIEPARGVYTWDNWDGFVLDAAQHNIRLEVMLGGENAFSSSRPLGNQDACIYPPANNGDFADFARAVVQRYGPGGAFWQLHPDLAQYAPTVYEIWNEPGINVYWGCQSNPAQYMALAKLTAAAIRSVYPQATIMNGSAPNKTTLKGGFWPKAFKLGAAHVFNAFGLHPYAPTRAGVLANVRQIRRFLASVGARSWPLYITEFGWATGGPRGKYTAASEAAQAQLIKTTYVALWNARNKFRLQGTYYYDWRDLPPPIDYNHTVPVDYWGLHTGLIQVNTTAKPALTAIFDASQQMK
jgi:hypothetical protein